MLSAIEIASSVDLLGRYANWSGSRVSEIICVDVSHDQPFKALHGYRRECYGSVVIKAGYLSVLGHRDYGGLLETCCYYRLSQGQVENVSEDSCQLVSACLEY